MASKVFSGAIAGTDAHIVEIETEVSYGLRTFDIVGLPDKAIEEAKERVGVALKNTRLNSPRTQPLRVLVNLAPADLKKEGSLYDLPIAIGFLLASRQLSWNPEGSMLLGELSLDGSLRPIHGALAFALLAKERRIAEILLPKANAPEAAAVNALGGAPIRIIGLESLAEATEYLNGKKPLEPFSSPPISQTDSPEQSLFPYIKGQEYAKRALEIAAAGNHNLFFYGPPGTGKSLLAKTLASLLPPLELEEALEVTKMHSIAGLLPPANPLITSPPFRNPHHTSSETALIGGGTPLRAGEITLAHRGVLFLDEFPEFHRDVLESLRQPIEEGEIALLRSRYRHTLPSRFLLVAAANPCPCGYYRSPDRECVCPPPSVQKYKRKLSGPLMDRIDMIVEVPPLSYEDLVSQEPDFEKERGVRQRIWQAREMQKQRFSQQKQNAHMTLAELQDHCQLDAQSHTALERFVNSGKLSARGYHRVLKLARTIADLAQSETISFQHVSEALSYRARDNT